MSSWWLLPRRPGESEAAYRQRFMRRVEQEVPRMRSHPRFGNLNSMLAGPMLSELPSAIQMARERKSRRREL